MSVPTAYTISYDTMTSLIVFYDNAAALQVAKSLDETVQTLLLGAAN